MSNRKLIITPIHAIFMGCLYILTSLVKPTGNLWCAAFLQVLMHQHQLKAVDLWAKSFPCLFNAARHAWRTVYKTAWLQKRDYAGYPELKEHLLKLGYSKPNIDKAITKSPLVYVDKSRGRSHYRYSWVGQ